MNKDECMNLILKNFNIETSVKGLKSIDLSLKSRELYYIDVFKEFKELKVMKVSSKNADDDIVFDIYFNAEDFGGLFNGYFTIIPHTKNAKLIFSKVSKICTDLKEYFYYVFKETQLLKIYLVSEDYKDVFLQAEHEGNHFDFAALMNEVYLNLCNYSTDEFRTANLEKSGIIKYVANFLRFNSKCSEQTKMFLLNLLIKGYSNHIIFCNGKIEFPYTARITSEKIEYNFGDEKITEYEFLDNIKEHNLTLFIVFDYDFKGR